MRTIRVKVYQFSELSKSAKQTAIENYLNNEDFSFIYDEAENTLKKFAEIFSIDIDTFDYEEPYRNKYSFDLSDNVLELTGQRLATYIWNNYSGCLYKGKYYSLWSKTEVSYKYYKDGYPVLKSKYSKVFLDSSCVLTGVCYDDDILSNIYDFMDKPKNIDFKELLEDCLSSFTQSVNNEVKASAKESVIEEHFSANEYEFTKDGKPFYK